MSVNRYKTVLEVGLEPFYIKGINKNKMPKLLRKKKAVKTSTGPYNGKKASAQQQQSSE